ncbi:MAG: hypothetical protein J3K34DRAFT_523242 [Monoraphidium minutum]|nr:MAG: hypothetical protein J3K34DRAFT_523242 [Monoraphidium minutum]
MAAPWEENPYKVVVEFQRSSAGVGNRTIKLRHSPNVVPLQLQGRISPTTWQMFMQEVQRLAECHPYVVSPSAKRVGGWVGAAALGAVVGLCCFNPDGGEYSEWVPQAEALVSEYGAPFAAGGAALSLKRAQHSYWIQIDVNPAMAVGQPVPAAAPQK